MNIVILGLGHLLQGDDGVGVHAARVLAASPPGNACVYEAGTPVFDPVSVLEQATTVIAIDAIEAGETPGTLVRFELDPADSVAPPPSLHDLDLPALLRSLPPGRRPRVLVAGIQPAVVGVGAGLSPPVAASLDKLVKMVRQLAEEAGRR